MWLSISAGRVASLNRWWLPVTVMVANFSQTECTSWGEEVLHFQNEWRYDFTGIYKAYLKFMQEQLCNCSWWTGKQPGDKDIYKEKKNSGVVSKNKTHRETVTTKRCRNSSKKHKYKRAKVAPTNTAEIFCFVIRSSSCRLLDCDRKLNAFVFQNSSAAKMIHLSRTKAVSLANVVLAHLSQKNKDLAEKGIFFSVATDAPSHGSIKAHLTAAHYYTAERENSTFFFSPRQQWNHIRNIWNEKHAEQPSDLNLLSSIFYRWER